MRSASAPVVGRSKSGAGAPRARSARPETAPSGPTVLWVEVGPEILATVLVGGTPLPGADRVAGGLGHIVVPQRRDRACWCGNLGCLTAVAGASGLARDVGLVTEPRSVADSAVDDLLRAERTGDTAVCSALRTAGWQLATVLRGCVSILGPDQVVIGGRLAVDSGNLRWGLAELYEAAPTPRCALTFASASDRRPVVTPPSPRPVAAAV